jgi:preprotein translocase subunit YajC|tara:strand:- start:3101 stop:3382 length:282 start_codon:yes stop_codon:yes gene_type:complete
VNEGLASFLPFIIIFVLFYFMLIRPQMKQAKEQRALIDNLKTGDEIISNSGILGKITKLSNQFAIIEVAKNVEIRIQKQTIQTLLPKGTIKSI